MTDAHDDTPSRGHERMDLDLNPEYDKYGIEALDDGAVILRIDTNKNWFERAGLLRHKQAKIVLKEYIDSEKLGGEGSFETVESVSVRRNEFESQLRDEIVELIYEGKVDEEQAKFLADDLAESISEQYR
jgi:hypothetical protein